MSIRNIITTLIGLLTILASFSCKKDNIVEESINHKFSVIVNGNYWGTDTLYSKFSLDQIYISTSFYSDEYYFVFTNVWNAPTLDDIEIQFSDPDGAFRIIKNPNFSFTNIDSVNHIYSAIFEVTYNKNDSIINISGTISNAEYFPEYCIKDPTVSTSDTFSLFGVWNIIGYKEENSDKIHYPPCEDKSYIKLINNGIPNGSYRGMSVRNGYGGSFTYDSTGNISFANFGRYMIYIGFNYDRNYEEEYFESLQEVNEYLIEYNILYLFVSTTGRTYIFMKN